MNHVDIGGRLVGHDQPAYVIGEIGINHNGEVANALRLVDVAVAAGCDAVKFQKREPRVAVPRSEWDRPRSTPWGDMTYIEYKERIEFGRDEYLEIDAYCKGKRIAWFASPWDVESVAFLEQFDPPAHKIASASVTDVPLLDAVAATGRPVILSTGMSTLDEVDAAVDRFDRARLILCQATSTYPAAIEELNLRVIPEYQDRYGVPVGYSGHETGLATTIAAVAVGACLVERHITLDRAMWGTDQSASVEPGGLSRLIRDIRAVETALGDGKKRVYPSEEGPRQKLRRV